MTAEQSRVRLVVGLGASAGGIHALKEVFQRVPQETGIAWVVILHLSPDYESRLAEVLQSSTTLPVTTVVHGAKLEADHVFVIPPSKTLTLNDHRLTLTDPERPEDRRSPVDLFFRTLAETHRTEAAAVVLSGTGPNGSNGLKRVKEYGGLVITQDPEEAEYDDMPRHAIRTGLVDLVLPVAEIPQVLSTYARRLRKRDGVEDEPDHAEVHRTELDTLGILLALVREQTGHDFSNYKAPTLLRRVERRIHIHALAGMSQYIEYVRTQPTEGAALVKEMLISVTNFFRDPSAFAAMSAVVIPRLFQGRSARDQVRVWVPGCATGEEAYSVAMVLTEHMATLTDPPSVQLFATDLDDQAVADARAAVYSEADVADVSPERLRQFFIREGDAFRIRRETREMVLFAPHNLIKDPPFSNLDLICCRNLLIYLNRGAQDRVLEIFHFALRPEGYLFLGTAESTDGVGGLFAPVDKSAHIYQSRAVHTRTSLPIPQSTPHPMPSWPSAPPGQSIRDANRFSAGDLHFRMLEEFGPPSVVISDEEEVVHVSASAGRFLQVPPGEPTRDLFRMINGDLRVDLRTVLHEAARTRQPVELHGARIRLEGQEEGVTIVVRPVLKEGDPARGFFLVFFRRESEVSESPEQRVQGGGSGGGDDPAAQYVEAELIRLKGTLRSTIEQHETQAEEFRAANEELQAVNEELRSSAEELETSKEELQSVNEELTTVNQELKIKIEELGLANNDFQNLMNSTDIGTIFLDRLLRIKLSTPRARDVFNILPSDAGRPLSDITTRLEYEGLAEDVRRVLDNLHTIEREIATRHGRWYLIRLLPYRTTDDRIEGVVITSQDTTDRRMTEHRVRASEQRLRLLIDSAEDYAIFTMRTDGRVDSWNKGAERMYGYTEDEILDQPMSVLFTPEDRALGRPEAELRRAARTGRFEDERWHLRKDGTQLVCGGITVRMGDDASQGFAKIARDLTSQKETERQVRRTSDVLEAQATERIEHLRAQVSARAASEGRIRGLVRQLVSAQEDERARVARDLHDQMGQQLTALRLVLERQQERSRAAGDLLEDIWRAQALVKDIDDGLDFLAWELRPAALDDLGLVVVLPRYIQAWSEHYGIPVEFRSGLADERLLPEAETTFYRVAQEALNNVAKHAKAAQVDVLLERRGDKIVLIVEDNGVGFDGAALDHVGGLGTLGMRERATLIGAALDIESTPSQGTTVYLRWQPKGAR